jgi:hypothetical protein
MASTDLALFTKDEQSFGENIARTTRILSRLLHDWAYDDRKSKPASLPAICFDKLAEFFCRVWDQLNEIDANEVRFQSGLKSHKGFHGPGRALEINRGQDRQFGVDPDDQRRSKWAFTTELVEKLQPAIGNANSLFSLSGAPWKYTCKVGPGLVLSQWDAWLGERGGQGSCEFLTAKELDHVERISDTLKLLSRDELRAIGTHCSGRATSADIKFNLSAWMGHFATILRFLNGEDLSVTRPAYVLVTTAREVRQKAVENREIYKHAFKRIITACPDGSLKNAILAVQATDDEIWEHEDVKRFANTSQAVLNFSIYVRYGLYRRLAITALSSREITEANTACLAVQSPIKGMQLSLSDVDLGEVDAKSWSSELAVARNLLFSLMPSLRDDAALGIH